MYTFSKNIVVIEKKLNIQEFKERFENRSVFSSKDILFFYREKEPSIPASTVNWRVYSLVNLGVLLRIGKGMFKIGKGSLYFPEIDNRIIRISRYIKDKFPFIQYCIWESSSIVEFGHHIPKTNFILVDAERDASESVFHTLKDEFKTVFYKPWKDLLNNILMTY